MITVTERAKQELKAILIAIGADLDTLSALRRL